MRFGNLVKRFGILAAFCVAAGVCAEVKVDDCFGDNMVLQRELPVRIRGTADPGESVTVSFAGQTVTVKADDKGDWLAKLEPLQASKTPAELTVAGANNTVTLKNILVGEVWLCTGQSNMFYSLFSKNPKYLHIMSSAITATANYPLIRIASVPLRASSNLERDSRMTWGPVTPESIKPFTAVGYFFGLELQRKLDVPIGLIRTCWGGTRIEPWTNLAGFRSVPEGAKLAKFVAGRTPGTPEYEKAVGKFLADQREWFKKAEAAVERQQVPPPPPALPAEFCAADRTVPGALYNAMIYPLTGMTVRGAIWYQGEGNLGQWFDYDWQMHALLNGWRQAFDNPDLQFYFVQIAPFRYNRDLPRNLIGLWQAQQAFADESGCGMAVINDYANPDDIHPNDKRPVGDRLARLALNRTYGRKEIACDAPRVKSWRIKDDKFVLSFDNASSWSTPGNRPVNGFEVAGIDGKYFPAAATINGAELEVSAPQVAMPRYLRYISANVAMGNLYNEHGLVPGPFQVRDVKPDEELAYLTTDRQGLIYEYDLFGSAKNGLLALVKDHSGDFADKKLSRLSYLFVAKDKQGKTHFAEVSLDPFSRDLRQVALPGSKVRQNIALPIKNIGIRTNVPNLIDGDQILSGNIEFFYTNYGPKNSKGIRNASDKVFDAGDQPATGAPGYGCIQFHSGRGEPIVCFNNFKGGKNADFGFGICPEGQNPDWTFRRSAKNYTSLRLYVFGEFN